jgi:hypothetical protein
MHESMIDKQQTSGESGSVPLARLWEPMTLTRVGTFGEVLLGNTGKNADMGTKKK